MIVKDFLITLIKKYNYYIWYGTSESMFSGGKDHAICVRKDEVNMNCKYCGYSLSEEDDHKFCPECGKNLNDDDVEVFDLRETNEDTESEEEYDEFIEDVVEEEYEEEESASVEEPTKTNKGAGIIAVVAGAVLIGCIIIVLAITSMNKKRQNEKEESTPSNVVQGNETEEIDDTPIGDYSSYKQYVIKLGTYKGVEINMIPDEITDEQVEQQIESLLANTSTVEEVTDRNDVQMGDIANIDYTGYLDGEPFDRGADTGFDLTIGSGQFIPGFEEGLIGAKVGETVDVDVTFPENYSADMAGKAVTFKVTINSIKQTVVPELTEDWVKEHSSNTTIDEYKQTIRTQMEKDAYSNLVSNKSLRVLDVIYQDTEFASYPEDSVNDYIDYMKSIFETYASYSGVSLEEYVTKGTNMTIEEFNESLRKDGEKAAGTDVICFAIADQEGISMSDEEYEEEALKYAKANNYQTVEELEKDYPKKRVYDYLIRTKVLDLISDNAVEITNETADK